MPALAGARRARPVRAPLVGLRPSTRPTGPGAASRARLGRDRVGGGVLRPAAARLVLARPALPRPARRASRGARPKRARTRAGRGLVLARPSRWRCRFLPFSSRYLVDLGTLVLIYVMLGWGLNIVVGLAGLLDLGYVAFYAVGAYSYALLAQRFRSRLLDCLPLAGAAGGLLAASCSAFRCCGCAATTSPSSRWVRRDHPHRADQLGQRSPAAPTASPASRGRPCSACPSPRAPAGRRPSPSSSASSSTRASGSSSSIT